MAISGISLELNCYGIGKERMMGQTGEEKRQEGSGLFDQTKGRHIFSLSLIYLKYAHHRNVLCNVMFPTTIQSLES